MNASMKKTLWFGALSLPIVAGWLLWSEAVPRAPVHSAVQPTTSEESQSTSAARVARQRVATALLQALRQENVESGEPGLAGKSKQETAREAIASAMVETRRKVANETNPEMRAKLADYAHTLEQMDRALE
jgi:hypothetical protein